MSFESVFGKYPETLGWIKESHMYAQRDWDLRREGWDACQAEFQEPMKCGHPGWALQPRNDVSSIAECMICELHKPGPCGVAGHTVADQHREPHWSLPRCRACEREAELRRKVERFEKIREMMAQDAGVYYGSDGSLYVLTNDVFAPAADGETVPDELFEEVYSTWKNSGEDALLIWAAKQRGVPAVDWRGNPLGGR